MRGRRGGGGEKVGERGIEHLWGERERTHLLN